MQTSVDLRLFQDAGARRACVMLQAAARERVAQPTRAPKLPRPITRCRARRSRSRSFSRFDRQVGVRARGFLSNAPDGVLEKAFDDRHIGVRTDV